MLKFIEEILHRFGRNPKQLDPINKIKIVLYRGDEAVDGFSFSTTPQSKLLRAIVCLVGQVLTQRRAR